MTEHCAGCSGWIESEEFGSAAECPGIPAPDPEPDYSEPFEIPEGATTGVLNAGELKVSGLDIRCDNCRRRLKNGKVLITEGFGARIVGRVCYARLQGAESIRVMEEAATQFSEISGT